MSQSIQKRHTYGTHRACPPEETLARVAPFLAQAGITRVADLTHLDELGIPVVQAVRPNSRTLSVSQGKGLTLQLAKVSAIMEAIELWHAEDPVPPVTQARVRELEPELGYDVRQLQHSERGFLHPGVRLDWVPARTLTTGRETYVPRALMLQDFTVRMQYAPPIFHGSSNGLASGNVKAEAALHGLLEVVERDALTLAMRDRWPRERLVDPATVTSPSNRQLLDRLTAAGVEFLIFDATGPTGLPCFRFSIWSQALPEIFAGAGCHLDKDVALSRAITEAAQTRLTLIAGARDDLVDQTWLWSRDLLSTPPVTLPRQESMTRDFQQIQSMASENLQADLERVSRLVEQQTGFSPMLVDLTRPDMGIPVTFIVAPGLRVAHEVI